MKRSRLHRKPGQLKRSWIRRTTRRKTDVKEELAEPWPQYLALHPRCSVCWWPKDRPGRWLERHHIQGRRRTGVHDIRNSTVLCNECHGGFHRGGSRSLELGHVLEAKLQECGSVDLEYLAWLRGKARTSLGLAPLPEWAAQERKDNAAWKPGSWR